MPKVIGPKVDEKRTSAPIDPTEAQSAGASRLHAAQPKVHLRSTHVHTLRSGLEQTGRVGSAPVAIVLIDAPAYMYVDNAGVVVVV